MPQNMIGVHEFDIEAFTKKLTRRIQESEKHEEFDLISIREIADVLLGSYASLTELKVDIIRRIMRDELTVFGCTDGTVGGLLVSKRTVFGNSENERSLRETSQLLHCTAIFVPELVNLGLLRSNKRGIYWHITYESILEFQKRYVSIVSLAKRIRTHPASLLRYCTDSGIEMLVVKRAVGRQREQAFVRVENQAAILSYRRKYHHTKITPLEVHQDSPGFGDDEIRGCGLRSRWSGVSSGSGPVIQLL